MNCNYLQKNTSGKALRRIIVVKEFYLVRWNEYHSISVFDFVKVHQFGSTVSSETLLEYVWYAGRGSWKGTLVVADLEQVDKIDASEFHNVKLNTIPKPQMDNSKLLAEIRF